jgi:hypothetical protein
VTSSVRLAVTCGVTGCRFEGESACGHFASRCRDMLCRLVLSWRRWSGKHPASLCVGIAATVVEGTQAWRPLVRWNPPCFVSQPSLRGSCRQWDSDRAPTASHC